MRVGDLLEGVGRHGRKHGRLRILDDRGPAVGANHHQAGGSVVEQSGEDDADDATASGEGRGTEEGIDGRAVEVLPGTGKDADALAFDEHVTVRRGDVNVSILDARAIPGMTGGQRSGAIQDVREHAGGAAGGVKDDEQGGAQIAGQAAEKLLEGLDSPGGSANDDAIAMYPSPLLRRMYADRLR